MYFTDLLLNYLPSYILFFYIAYIVLIEVNRYGQGNKVKIYLQQQGFKPNKKVSNNIRLFLLKTAKSALKERGINSTNIQTSSAIPWLISSNLSDCKFTFFKLYRSHGKSLADLGYILTLYDVNRDEKGRLNSLENIELPEYCELIDEGSSISITIESNSVSLSNVNNLFVQLGLSKQKKGIQVESATFSERLKYYVENTKWLHQLFLVVLCFYFANSVLYSMTSLSMEVSLDVVEYVAFWESTPLLFAFSFTAQLLCFYLVVRQLINLIGNIELEDRSAIKQFYIFNVAILFLGINFFLEINFENEKYIENQRFLAFAEHSLEQDELLVIAEGEQVVIPRLADGIVKFLQQNKFEVLKQKLSSLHENLSLNINMDVVLYQAYLSFFNGDEEVIQQIERWQQFEPKNLQSKLAEAFNYYGKGWQIRGNKYASNTDDESLYKANLLFAKAESILHEIQDEKELKLIVAALLIDVYRTTGRYQSAKKIFEKKIKSFPESYLLRERYLIALQPKWGGGFVAMSKIIDDAQSYRARNPSLIKLKGFVLETAGDILALDKRSELSGLVYGNALQYGRHYRLLWKKGKTEYRQENYISALQYFNEAIELNSNDAEIYYWRSLTYFQLKNYTKSQDDQLIALKLRPFEDKYSERVGRVRQYAAGQKFREHYGFSLDGESKLRKNQRAYSDADKYYQQALSLIKSQRYKEAINKLYNAIELEPDEMDYYLALDMLLAQNKQWLEIVKYWKKYLKLFPQQSRAHLEISGTYYHLGDNEKSYYHLTRAAELGNENAKRLLQRMSQTTL